MAQIYTARTQGILGEPIGDELVLYDTEDHVAHALAQPAATVWTACQPGLTLGELVARSGLDVELASATLADLEHAGLISSTPADAAESPGGPSDPTLSRRGVLAGAAALGLAAPLVLSVPIAAAVGVSHFRPTATSLTPASGPAAGGTSVSVAGTNFMANGTSVTIGGTTIPYAAVTVISSTDLTFVTPAEGAGTATVTVTTTYGTSAPVPNGFTYLA